MSGIGKKMLKYHHTNVAKPVQKLHGGNAQYAETAGRLESFTELKEVDVRSVNTLP